MEASLNLDLPRFQSEIQVKQEEGKRWIWDTIRRKWLVLLPEELVRQLLVQYLLLEAGVNKNRIAIERGITVNGLQKRCDILIFDNEMQPWLLIECKAPSVKLNDTVFHQVARYNMRLQVPYLLVCNGPQTYCCSIDFANEAFHFLSNLPDYPKAD
mgnify:CR=1 FL=1